MSGIEVVGIVLAVLPIAVSAAKSCSESIDDSKKLLRTQYHDDVKRDLFDDLYRELFLFNRHVKNMLFTLPSISQQRCNEILVNLDQQDWQSKSDIIEALRSHLGTDFDDFDYAISQVYHWLNRILIDRYLQCQVTSKNSTIFLSNLKKFTEASHAKVSESEFRARLHLWRKEGKLRKEVKNLRKWREFVEVITGNNNSRSGNSIPEEKSARLPRPTCVVPQMSKALYYVLHKSWNCSPGCTGNHGAKICLQTDSDLHRKAGGDQLKYKLLFSPPPSGPAIKREMWRETAIDVKCIARPTQVGFAGSGARAELVESVCSTLSTHPWSRGHKLRFTVEYAEHNASSEIYHARKYMRSEFKFQPSGQDVSLTNILADIKTKFDLPQRRRLALVLSYGMMTLSGSPWLKDRWCKEHISFFHTHTNDICITQPLVSKVMEGLSSQTHQLSLDVMHPLPPIMSLGILLLELETGEPIESMRSDDDWLDPENQIADENTDFTAAIREAEKRLMSSPRYKEAVLACLNEQIWDDGCGEEPNILQEKVREKIYEQIIYKLESDLDALVN